MSRQEKLQSSFTANQESFSGLFDELLAFLASNPGFEQSNPAVLARFAVRFEMLVVDTVKNAGYESPEPSDTDVIRSLANKLMSDNKSRFTFSDETARGYRAFYKRMEGTELASIGKAIYSLLKITTNATEAADREETLHEKRVSDIYRVTNIPEDSKQAPDYRSYSLVLDAIVKPQIKSSRLAMERNLREANTASAEATALVDKSFHFIAGLTPAIDHSDWNNASLSDRFENYTLPEMLPTREEVLEEEGDFSPVLSFEGKNCVGADFRHVKLAGASFRNVDLTGAKLENADLTGVLVSGIASLPFVVQFQYQGASLTHKGLSDDVVRPVRDQYFLEKGVEAPRINGIFELLQFVQDHPNDAFATQLDRALTVYAIKQKAFAPVQMSEKDSAQLRELDVDAFEKNYGNGLGQAQLYQVMQSMRMGFLPETAKSLNVTRYETETTKRDADTNVFFTLHERVVPNTPDALPQRVINIAGTLNAQDRVEPAQHHVDANDFVRVLSDIAKLSKTVDCIQMPLAAGEGRNHFLQLQIFKKDDGIGARIIDSTTNHPLATVPTDFVQRVLVENADSLQSILGTKRAHVEPVSVVRTGEQVRPADKKCPLYVAKGMEAATQAILSQGSHLLGQDEWAKNTVRHAHHVVSKTDEMALVFQLVEAKETQLSDRHPIMVSDQIPSETDSDAGHDSVLNMHDDVESLVGETPDASGLEARLLPGWEEDNDVMQEVRKPSAALDSHKKIEGILRDLKFEELNNPSDEKRSIVMIAVDKALEQYLLDRGSVKKGGVSSFFRQMNDAGKDYAVNARLRMGRDPNETLAVVREILHMGLQKNGQLEVKSNSRLDHLLRALSADGLIEQSSSAVGVMSLDDVKVKKSVQPTHEEAVSQTTFSSRHG